VIISLALVSLPIVTPSFLLAVSVTMNWPILANLCLILRDVVVVSLVLSPKFQAKYDALPEQDASKVIKESLVIVFCEHVKQDSVGFEQDVVKKAINDKIINGYIALFMLVASIILCLSHIPHNNKTDQFLGVL